MGSRAATAAIALCAALAVGCAPAQAGPRVVSIAPAHATRPLPSTGADRVPPSPADADDSKMKHVWASHDDPEATSAPADGSIARWNDDDWYIVHDYAPAGREFLALEPGDLVRIDGRTVRIAGSVDEPRDSYSNEVRAQIGDDVTVFQTCAGESALRVAYGREVPRSAGAGNPSPALPS